MLGAAGIACVADPVDIDESVRPGESPAAHVERLAREKAVTGAARHPGTSVLGADTVVVVDGDILGKPLDDAEARVMLRRLSGRAHDVLTGIAVAADGGVRARVETTRVWFRTLSEQEIDWYVATGECADKAGAYGIQGAASRFIPRIEGSYSNVVGLPVAAVVELLGV